MIERKVHIALSFVLVFLSGLILGRMIEGLVRGMPIM